MNIDIAGEFRLVVLNADGKVKQDTGYQKNLILDQGLDWFGGAGDASSTSFLNHCVIGSGNSTPVATQNQLDSAVAIKTGVFESAKYDYTPEDGTNLYKTNRVHKYEFTGLSNVNVSEIGLASTGALGSYYLCTRVLIKDSFGSPTVITIRSGETLRVFYKIWRIYSTLDQVYYVDMLDGVGGKIPYKVTTRLTYVGTNRYDNFGLNPIVHPSSQYLSTSPNGLSNITSTPSGTTDIANAYYAGVYTTGTFKSLASAYLGVNNSNYNIKTVIIDSPQCATHVQIQYERVSNGAGIPKTANHTLILPFELSWGRYEGEL